MQCRARQPSCTPCVHPHRARCLLLNFVDRDLHTARRSCCWHNFALNMNSSQAQKVLEIFRSIKTLLYAYAKVADIMWPEIPSLDFLHESHLNHLVLGNFQIRHLCPRIFSKEQKDVKQALPQIIGRFLDPHLFFSENI